jgi:inward rectifier potassium channel
MDTKPIITTEAKVKTDVYPKVGQAFRPRMRRGQRIKPIIIGQDGSQWKDVYHAVLTVPWWGFFLSLAAIFLGVNAIFAGLYLLVPGSIMGAHRGSFSDAFFFSVETFGSIGYGVLSPKTTYANVIMTCESFTALVNLAVVTGVIFARFSRPFARVVFSNVAVIVPFEGVSTLMFRAANQRANQILDATATVSLARQVTTQEGITMRRFEELKLVRASTPLFSLSWTIMHKIDETSPLYGVTIDTLYDYEMDIIVLLRGTDETFAQVIYARHAFEADDILFDRRFVDVLHVGETGRMEVDLHHFHDTEPWTPS